MRTIGSVAHGRDNNFHLMRFVAAALVLVSHTWPLTGTPGEPLEAVAGFSFGHLGVDIFFVVSGFLVTASLFARRSVGSFVRARALRILPALVVSAFGCALVIGPLVTHLPLAEYFARSGTWSYALRNSTTWPWGVQWGLPGVFPHNPGGSAVNGVLWSLPWEITMYAGLAALGVLAVGRTPRLTPRGVGWTLLVTAVVVSVAQGVNEAFSLSTRFEVVQGLRLLALFTTAGSVYVFRDRIPLAFPWFAVALALLVTSARVHGLPFTLYPVTLVYVVLWLAYAPAGALRLANRSGDYSYGFYLWQFPIEQWIVETHPGIGQWRLLVLAFPIATALAAASWYLVESPMLALKERAPRAPGTR